MTQIVAERLVKHLEHSGFVVMKSGERCDARAGDYARIMTAPRACFRSGRMRPRRFEAGTARRQEVGKAKGGTMDSFEQVVSELL